MKLKRNNCCSSKPKKAPWTWMTLGGCLISSPVLFCTNCTLNSPGELLKKSTGAQIPHRANWIRVFEDGTWGSTFLEAPHVVLMYIMRTTALADLCLQLPIDKPPYPLQERPSLMWPVYFSSLILHHSLPLLRLPRLLHTYPPEPRPFSHTICTNYSFCLECYFPSLFLFQFSVQNHFPPRVIHCSFPCKNSPFLPKAHLAFFSCVSMNTGRQGPPLFTSPHLTQPMFKKHLLVNEWIGNSICLSFWDSELC